MTVNGGEPPLTTVEPPPDHRPTTGQRWSHVSPRGSATSAEWVPHAYVAATSAEWVPHAYVAATSAADVALK
ncbi:hypothetical protein Tco_0147161, partial [Tanacetum coccineum]